MGKRTPKKQAGNAAAPCEVPQGWIPAGQLPPEADAPSWVFEPWIPRGYVSLVTGLPESGKSSFLLWLAACVSAGRVPDAAAQVEPRPVILCAAEDSYKQTLAPRLVRLGACEDRIIVPQGNTPGTFARLRLPADLPSLLRAVATTRAALLILDPAAAYLDAADVNNETACRAILDGLQELAQRTACAIVLTRNFNKRHDGPLLSRINGSAAWRDVPRSILCAVRHPIDPAQLILVRGKASVGPRPAPRRYHFEVVDGHPVFSLDEECALSLEDCEDAAGSPGERAEWRAAHELLCGLIGDTWLKACTIYSAAQAQGIGKGKVWRAKVELGVQTRRMGWGPGSHVEWGPPGDGWPADLKPGGHAAYIPPTPARPLPPPGTKKARRSRKGGGRGA
jgi:AAA domain